MSLGTMVSSNLSFRVSAVQRGPGFLKNVDLRPSLPSLLKTFVKELQHAPLKLDISRTIKDTSKRMLDGFVDSVFQFVDQPYLPSQSNFAPVEELGHAFNIENIEGEIPADFPNGVYMRNGANPLFGGLKSAVSTFGQSSSVWIEGEGMIHALYFTKDNDLDCWSVVYNNKYVETDSFLLEKRENKPTFLPSIEGDPCSVLISALLNLLRFGSAYKFASSTSVFAHSGKIYTVTESHMPHEIDINTLETIGGEWDVEKSWGRPFASHPKRAPGTGELVIAGPAAVKPFLVVGVISADGKQLLHKVDLELERSIICHDLGVTENYNIIIDHPLTADIGRLVKGGPLIKFYKEDYAKIGVMPRFGDAKSVKWFEVDTHCTFHILNCYEDGDEVVVKGCTARESIIPGPEFGHDKLGWFSRGFMPNNHLETNACKNPDAGYLFARVYEWRLNMVTGNVSEKYLTGTSFSMDFPIINENFTGLNNEYGYTQVVDLTASSSSGWAKYGMLAKLYLNEPATSGSEKMMEDLESKEFIKIEYHMLGEDTFCTGATFVCKHGIQDEDDGWIICFVHNEKTDASQVHIIDAKNFEAEPIAKITLPQRVPYGFHGSYFSAPI